MVRIRVSVRCGVKVIVSVRFRLVICNCAAHFANRAYWKIMRSISTVGICNSSCGSAMSSFTRWRCLHCFGNTPIQITNFSHLDLRVEGSILDKVGKEVGKSCMHYIFVLYFRCIDVIWNDSNTKVSGQKSGQIVRPGSDFICWKQTCADWKMT